MAKKTKKIETPIDQRETFVSIQKNFADSDLSVEEKLKTLYSLQLIDTEIDKILQLRGELPIEVENLENEIADMKAKISGINTQIEESTKKIAEYKMPDLNANDIEAAVKIIEGSARNMGLEIVD